MKKFLFICSIIFLFCFIPNVNALETGEQYPEFSTKRTKLASVIGSAGEIPLYGYNPQLESFNTGLKSLVVYTVPDAGLFSSLEIAPTNISFIKGTTYSASIRIVGSNDSINAWGNMLLNNNQSSTRSSCIVSGGSVVESTCVSVRSGQTLTINFTFKAGGNGFGFYVNSSAPSRVNTRALVESTYGFYLPTNWQVTSSDGSQTTVIIDTAGIQAEQSKTTDAINGLNQSITSSDVTSSQAQADSFFKNFQSSDFGLSDVVTMPLTLINSLNNSTCLSLHLTIPFVNKAFDLPCMSSIYKQHFGSFFTLYQTIIFGFTAYWVCIRIYNLVKDFKNPDHDEIEVLDL